MHPLAHCSVFFYGLRLFSIPLQLVVAREIAARDLGLVAPDRVARVGGVNVAPAET